MNHLVDVEARIADLIGLVASSLDHDAPFGGWMVDEGQRVLGGATSLLAALRSGSVDTLLGDSPVIDYLGRAWLEVHGDCYEAATLLDATLSAVPSGDSFMPVPHRGSA